MKYCSNCNKEGHYVRICTEPVTSHGIMLLKPNLQEILLVQRKVSIGFFCFMLGKYNHAELMQEYLMETTPFERNLLETKSFDEIWEFLWGERDFFGGEPVWVKNYMNAKKKYLQLDVQGLLSKTKSMYNDTEFLFPKGKKNDFHESSLKCAVREFTEETGIEEENISILKFIPPIVEIYLSTNKVSYRSIYYVAVINDFTKVNLKFTSSEIKSIKWFTFADALKKFRSNVGQVAKKNSLQSLLKRIIYYMNSPRRMVSVSLIVICSSIYSSSSSSNVS